MARRTNGSTSSSGVEHISSNGTPDTRTRLVADAESDRKPEFTSLHEEAFQVLMDMTLSQPRVVERDEIIGLSKASYEGNYVAIDRWLSLRLSEIKKHWKRILQVPHHRVMDVSRVREYATAAELKREKKLSWAQLARKVDLEGYRKDARRTIERLRKGVTAVGKRRGRSDPMFLISLVFGPSKLRPTALKPYVAPSPKWARKKLKDSFIDRQHLVERAGWPPAKILDNAQSEYMLWINYVAGFRNSRKRKWSEERVFLHLWQYIMTEFPPESRAEGVSAILKEIQMLCAVLLAAMDRSMSSQSPSAN
ncbi:MAG: hypothetical protein HY648_08390 [Acidobacteria bacterium]|nr:hypothetical protein [Acidobacteriota bacterium]